MSETILGWEIKTLSILNFVEGLEHLLVSDLIDEAEVTVLALLALKWIGLVKSQNVVIN